MKKYALLVGTAFLLVGASGGNGPAAPAPVEKPKEPVTLRGHRYCVNWLAFSPDGKTLASVSYDNDVRIWDIASGKCTATLTGHTDIAWAVAFSPDGKKVASGSDDHTLRVWDLSSGKTVATFRTRDGGFRNVLFTPDGKGLASGNLGVVRVWDLQTRKERVTLQVSSTLGLGALAYRPAGRLVAASNEKTVLSFWDVESGKSTVSAMEGACALACAFSPDCKAFAAGDGGLLQLWDVATAKKTASFHVPDDITSLGFSPDGKMLAVGSRKSRAGGKEPNSVRLVDMGTRKVFATFTGRQTGALMCVRFSPDGKLLASASGDGTIVLWGVPRRPQPGK